MEAFWMFINNNKAFVVQSDGSIQTQNQCLMKYWSYVFIWQQINILEASRELSEAFRAAVQLNETTEDETQKPSKYIVKGTVGKEKFFLFVDFLANHFSAFQTSRRLF